MLYLDIKAENLNGNTKLIRVNQHALINIVFDLLSKNVASDINQTIRAFVMFLFWSICFFFSDHGTYSVLLRKTANVETYIHIQVFKSSNY